MLLRACFVLLFSASVLLPQQQFPFAEVLSYDVEWRLVTAGNASIRLTRAAPDNWRLELDLTTAGLVNRLYHVKDSYKMSATEKFCGTSVEFDAQEGKHHMTTAISFDEQKHHVKSVIKDVVANSAKVWEADAPPCTHEIMGALLALRQAPPDLHAKIVLPVTDGKKLANVKVEAQSKEKITVKGKSYNTVRYETFVFDNVLYRRKGRLFIWLTEDGERLPVQLRFQFGFPIGEVTLELEKVEKL